MVPVEDADDAEDAEEESSSWVGSGSGFRWSASSAMSCSSGRSVLGIGGSNGRPASLALAKERCRSLIARMELGVDTTSAPVVVTCAGRVGVD